MRVLLIWEALPEEVKAFLIEDPTKEQLSVLQGANNKIAGIHDYEGDLKILSSATTDAEYADEDVDPKWAGLWSKCGVQFPVSGPIDLVVRSGFVM
jgi:hypothetical protein